MDRGVAFSERGPEFESSYVKMIFLLSGGRMEPETKKFAWSRDSQLKNS